jgi:hypothetical protein
MSLHEIPVERTDTMPNDQLQNAVTNYLVSAMQAADWEPSGKSATVQWFTKGQRTVGILDPLVMGAFK